LNCIARQHTWELQVNPAGPAPSQDRIVQHLPNLAVADSAFRLQTLPEEAVAHPGWLRARASLLAALHSGRAMVLLGLPGSGKTLLLQEVARALRQEGRAVRLAGRGDALNGSDDAHVLLVDEAGCMGPDALAGLCARPAPFVAAALPGFTDRLTRLSRPVETVTLPPLAPDEVARYVASRLAAAGQPRGLLEPEAVLALARHSGGLLRLVNTIGGAAVFLAKLDGASRVGPKHVEEAASMRNDPGKEAALPAPAPPLPVALPEPVAALPNYSAAMLRRRVALSTMAAASGLLFAMPWLTRGRLGAQSLDAQDSAGSQAVQVAQAGAGAPLPVAPDDASPAPADVSSAPGIQPGQPRPEVPQMGAQQMEAQQTGTQQTGTQQMQPASRVAAPSPSRAEPARRTDPASPAVVAEGNRAVAASDAPVRFQGPIFNETMGQGGHVTLVIRKQVPTGAITARFNASQGLSGSGVLAGNVSGTGRITASGQLLMGRNAFMCDLSGTLSGGTLTGSASFVNSNGGPMYHSRFNLVRA